MSNRLRSLSLVFFTVLLATALLPALVLSNAGTNVLECTAEVHVESGSESSNNKNGFSYVGMGTPLNTLKGLFYFNLTELQDAYNYGYYPETNVHLRFYYKYTTSGMEGHNITWTFSYIETSWDEATVTWDTQPDYSTVQQTIYMTKTELWSTKEFGYFDVHDMLEAVLNGTQTDYYGILVTITDPEYSYEQVQVDAHDAGTYAPSVYFNYDEDEDEEPPTSGDDLSEITDFLIVFLVLFFPALTLGGALASNNQTASLAPMGFITGLVIGAVMGVIAGLIPSWAVIFVGMGIILLLWSAKR